MTVHVTGDGSHVSFRSNRLLVIRDDEVVCSLPIMRVARVVLSGTVNISGRAMNVLLQRNIPVVMLTSGGRALGRLEPFASTDADDRLRQLTTLSDNARRLELARPIVSGKIANQRALLSRRLRIQGGEQPTALTRLSELSERSLEATTRSQLLGFEGAAAAMYVKAWHRFLPSDIGFNRRNRAGPDLVNALWNYCSALLREQLVTSIHQAGLDTRLSVLHESFRGRPTLAFDLMEEWRPVLADTTVLSLVRLRAVGSDDLAPNGNGQLRLTSHARRAAASRFQERVGSTYRMRGAEREGTFADLIHGQVEAFRHCLRDRSLAYKPFAWR